MSPDAATTAELVERGDLDELIRQIDRLCDARAWDGLLDLRDRCRAALARGKQLWSVAAHAEYRMALEAPGPWAAAMLETGAGRFALGPLPEVAAARHSWIELGPHAPRGPVAALAAHERVVRGEDLSGDPRIDDILELPLALESWEPAYPVAEYKSHEASFPQPSSPRLTPVDLPQAMPEIVDDPDSCRALAELATPWVTESNGRVETVCVEGGVWDAVRALGLTRGRGAAIDPALALAHMAWTAASGGAHGRRRGMAAGRFGAWWALADVAGLGDECPASPGALGQASGELQWVLWDAGEPDTGWSLRMAVADPDEDLAWAIAATDSA